VAPSLPCLKPKGEQNAGKILIGLAIHARLLAKCSRPLASLKVVRAVRLRHTDVQSMVGSKAKFAPILSPLF